MAVLGEIFNATTIGFIIAVALLFIAILWLKGLDNAVNGIVNGLNLFMRYALLIISAMLLASLIQILIPKEIINQYLGNASSWRGIVLGTVIGALFPGAPYAVFPLFASFIKIGASIPTVVAMITSWGLVSIGRIPFQIAIMGSKFTALYVVSIITLPILAGFIAMLIENLIS